MPGFVFWSLGMPGLVCCLGVAAPKLLRRLLAKDSVRTGHDFPYTLRRSIERGEGQALARPTAPAANSRERGRMDGIRRSVFISYRRQSGYEFAHLVDVELRARGLRTFIDVADSDPGRFWAQAQAAIHSCCALVLICTNGSFENKPGDDWVLREVTEAMALNRPIVPVFSQDFKLPTALPPLLAQAIEYNGVSMDTQFHVAAFDHLSQLVGGRKRSEQRRRVAILGSLATLTLLASLALGAREVVELSQEFSREREARQAADERSEELAEELTALKEKRAEDLRAATEREKQAKYDAERLAEGRRRSCSSGCESARRSCESNCFYEFDGQFRASCQDTCKQQEPFCKSGCQ